VPKHLIFPLYGLNVTDESDDHSFVFGDATIIGRRGARRLLPGMSEEQKDFALKDNLLSKAVPDWKPLPPRDHLVEPRSSAYIAVRRKRSGARPYAKSIAAFLSACAVLRGIEIAHFSIEGRDAVWLLDALDVDHDRFRTKVVQNSFFATSSIDVSASDLRESYMSGKEDRSDIHDFVKARHDFVHEGMSPDEEKAKRLAGKALLIAWITWDLAAALSARVKTREAFQSFVRSRNNLHCILEEYRAAGRKTGDLESFVNREFTLSKRTLKGT